MRLWYGPYHCYDSTTAGPSRGSRWLITNAPLTIFMTTWRSRRSTTRYSSTAGRMNLDCLKNKEFDQELRSLCGVPRFAAPEMNINGLLMVPSASGIKLPLHVTTEGRERTRRARFSLMPPGI
ncbi:hypothetical protein VNO77_42386 [Canavalia gladiata]|uniref:Uncharacterized protein n=1 Tax=Canavalia gladiata TaxID=3824 RepID=A0AAN9K0K1_CANGL